MFRSLNLRRLSVLGLALLLTLATVSPAVAKNDRPFKGQATGTWDNIFNGLFNPPANFAGVGPVTHMGLTTQQGTAILGPPIAEGVFPGFGSVTITAANGDQLTLNYEGLLNAATGEGLGVVTFTGGTGRFANATGGGTYYAIIDLSLPNQPMTLSVDGRINY